MKKGIKFIATLRKTFNLLQVHISGKGRWFENAKVVATIMILQKKSDEISQFEKDDLEKLRKELETVESSRKEILENYGSENKIVKQLVDLALLSNNMLRGEDLSTFVKRSVELL